jgi:pilus assembly protein CpaB
MKSSRAVIVLFLALACGIAAMVVGSRFVGGKNTSTNKVIITTQEISAGTPITVAMVTEVDWPAGSIPTGAFKTSAEIVGRVPTMTLQRGEPALEARLAAVGTKGGLSAIIPEGYRAISVRVNEVMGVAGFALPGTFVDLMVNLQRTEDNNPISKIVLERIQVLAVAQESSQDATKPKVVSAVTLKVTPEQAEKIDLARSIGQLSLVLRNQSDTNVVETDGIRADDLMGIVKPKKPEPIAVAPVPSASKQKTVARPPAPKVVPQSEKVAMPIRAKVEVIRGVQRSEAEL